MENETQFDVAVVGGGTAGLMFARMMAEQDYSVLVIERKPQEKVGDEYSAFHFDEERFNRYSLAKPQPGDADYSARFEAGVYRSARGTHTCYSHCPNLLLKRAPFLRRMQAWAGEKGVEIRYQTTFTGFLLNKEGKINGIRCKNAADEYTVRARLTVDCSGKPAAARRQAPGEHIDTSGLTPRDLFYIYMHYAKLKYPEKDTVDAPIHYSQWIGWIGQGERPGECIFGTSASLSYEHAAKSYACFQREIPFPKHEEIRVEKGTTIYRRSPYSMVTDGFLCIGDAACMTKPFSGEGVTSGWVGCEIASRVAGKAMVNGAYPTKEALWEYNELYAKGQGADFAYILAVMCNTAASTPEENEYEFAHKIVFNDNNLTHCNIHYNYDAPITEVLPMLGRVFIGVVTGNIALNTLRAMLRGIVCATRLKSHYKKYPRRPVGYARWTAKAEKLWRAVGSMADLADKAEATAAKAVKTVRLARAAVAK
ncbi:MAG: NAD(P)/FAD-dependent oxidoreductase [Oscillospiraceae bacterium]|jgi:flavin-dependent dehydrogenase|nr:NAD(P)/FAD-dependent oxidoreductase [Oscillospiraceae bacterium]